MAAPTRTQAAGGFAAAIALATTFVAAHEGLKNDPYDDLAGIRTVCYGETHGVEERHYANAECIAKLQKSLAKHAQEAQNCLPELPPATLAAFASFTYNVGAANACGSTAFRKARAGDLPGACDALTAWNKVKTSSGYVISNGLVNRRAQERALCLRGVGS